MSDEHRIDPDEHREVLLPVIERWFPNDDAPYNRIDELMSATRAAGFEPGVKEWAVDYWTARVTDAESERDRLRGLLEAREDERGGLLAENNRLRAVVEAVGRYAETPTDETLAELLAARTALDGSGVMGGPPDDGVSELAPNESVVIRGVVITMSELEQLADTKRALGAHRSGAPVSLDHETGQWTIDGEGT